jgi:hypothetical protein
MYEALSASLKSHPKHEMAKIVLHTFGNKVIVVVVGNFATVQGSASVDPTSLV